jgi:uncharacterized protein YceK
MVDYITAVNGRYNVVSHVQIDYCKGCQMFAIHPWDQSSPLDTNGLVEIGSEASPQDRHTVLSLNTSCLTKVGGCGSIADLLPTVWQKTASKRIACKLQNDKGFIEKPAKEHILDSPFTEVTRTEALPASVKQSFAKITGEPSFALANPGQKYQATDFVVDRGLPRRRLVFAGVRGDEWFVHYELGGIGHSYCVLLFKVDPQNRGKFVWGGVGFHGAKNLDQLRKMVAAGQFSDEMQSYW